MTLIRLKPTPRPSRPPTAAIAHLKYNIICFQIEMNSLLFIDGTLTKVKERKLTDKILPVITGVPSILNPALFAVKDMQQHHIVPNEPNEVPYECRVK